VIEAAINEKSAICGTLSRWNVQIVSTGIILRQRIKRNILEELSIRSSAVFVENIHPIRKPDRFFVEIGL